MVYFQEWINSIGKRSFSKDYHQYDYTYGETHISKYTHRTDKSKPIMYFINAKQATKEEYDTMKKELDILARRRQFFILIGILVIIVVIVAILFFADTFLKFLTYAQTLVCVITVVYFIYDMISGGRGVSLLVIFFYIFPVFIILLILNFITMSFIKLRQLYASKHS
jgi:uncharacterized membrane protein